MRAVDDIIEDIKTELMLSFLENHVRYKVLTMKMTSTGLLHSSIVKYRPKHWNYPMEPPQYGKHGPGGLWANRNLAMARSLQKYLEEKHGMKTRIHLCIIDKILFQSSYRSKTNRLLLLDPVGRWKNLKP